MVCNNERYSENHQGKDTLHQDCCRGEWGAVKQKLQFLL